VHIALALNAIHDTLAHAMTLAHQARFAHVELPWPQVQRQLVTRGGGLNDLHAHLRQNHLTVDAISAGPISAERPDQLPAQIEYFQSLMGRCREVGCTRLIVTAGRRTLEHFHALRETLLPLAEHADALGLHLALVNHVGTRVQDMLDLHALLLDERLRFVRLALDALQFYHAAVNPADPIIEFACRLTTVRVGDALGSNPLPLGRGEVNLAGLIGCLKSAGYAGPITLAQLPLFANASASEHLHAAYQTLTDLLAENA
jgi:sugar phosphate isomerase/epimerase